MKKPPSRQCEVQVV